MPAFPHHLCTILHAGGERAAPVVLRSEVERGIPRHRRAAADALVQVSLQLGFETAQASADFDAWFYGEALAGAAWFDFTNPRTNTVVQARVVGGDLGSLTPLAEAYRVAERSIELEYIRPGFRTLPPGRYSISPSQILQVQRASTATFVDAAGVLQTAAAHVARFTHLVNLRNLLRWSAALSNLSVWNRVASAAGDVAPVITDGAAVGVSGSQTASLVVFNAASGAPNSSVLGQSVAAAAGLPASATCISTLWLRAATPADVGKVIVSRHVAGGAYVSLTLTDSWQLLSSTEVSIGGSFDFGLRPSVGSSSGQVSVLVDGLQLELGTVRTSPNVTGPQPRLSASPGLLVEDAATNLVRQSQALNLAPWDGSVSAVGAPETYRGAAPFWTLAKTVAVGSELRAQVFGAVSAGQVITITVALLSGSVAVCGVGLYDNPGSSWGLPADSTAEIIEGPGAVARVVGALFDVTGLSATIPTVVRVTRTFQAATTEGRAILYPGSATSTTIGHSVKATRVQVGTSDGSYIPTTTAPVTRAADLITVTA